MVDFNKFVDALRTVDPNFKQKEPTRKSVFDFLLSNRYIHVHNPGNGQKHGFEFPIPEGVNGEVINHWVLVVVLVDGENTQFYFYE